MTCFDLMLMRGVCSIDQDNIEDNLVCLPVFLAGCNTLLALCGDSYLKRMVSDLRPALHSSATLGAKA